MEKTVTRKLHWHIMSRFCLLTILNHMDRANLVCFQSSILKPQCPSKGITVVHWLQHVTAMLSLIIQTL